VRGVAAVLAAAFVATWVGRAAADGDEPSRAEVMFNEGREAMRRGDLEEACPKFAESQQIYPSPGTLFNLAVCEQRKGEEARAWAHFRALVESLPPDDKRLPLARSWAEKLSRRLPRLTLHLASTAPPDTRVWFDNVELSADDLDSAFVTDPGAHRVLVRAPGRVERRYDLNVAEGKSSSLVVAPAQAPDWQAPAAPPPSPLLPTPWRRFELERVMKARHAQSAAVADSLSTAGYGLVVLGGASVSIGSIITLFALDRQKASDRNFALLSAGSTLSGLTATIAGILVLRSHAESQRQQRAPRAGFVAPFAAPGGGGLAFRATF
jgi:hypothetical protein